NGKGKGRPPRITGPAETQVVTVDSNGRFMLRGVTVACPAGVRGSCAVYSTAKRGRHVAAAIRFRLKHGRSSAVRLRLRDAERRRLGHQKHMRLVVRLTARAVNGAKATRTFRTPVKARAR